MPKLILFYTSWCKPCNEYKKIIDELISEKGDQFEFESYDADSDEQEVKDLICLNHIRSVPTTVIIRNGREINKFGLIPKDELIRLLGLNDI